MLGVNFMKAILILAWPLVTLAQLDPREGLRDASVTAVRLTNSSHNNYGILEIYFERTWTAVCDDSFTNIDAMVACRQLNFNDGRLQKGSALGINQAPIKAVKFQCKGTESSLNKCKTTVSSTCLSNNYVTLYCSRTLIIEKDFPEIRIKDGQSSGLLEANQYGFWGPICDTGWTDMEAHAACQQLGKAGGYAYYATTDSDYPMVVGRFNCSDDVDALNECDFKGFGESLGCQYPITRGSRRAAGVFCYDHQDGVQFRLSDRWYGKVQVKHNGEWGRICNANWGNKEASTLCRQLGYVDGRAENTPSKSSGMIRMDNVNCSGTESSILECNHRSSWTDSLEPCNDARAICNTTICGSIDIRNDIKNLNRLENCTVIEGNLTFLLIDTGKWEDYQKYSFPNLIEITEFLLLFRVIDLRSLNHLFPNLAIIRGDRLFSDYALVAFEMPDLVELGLSSLVSIPRGAVRLEKNPNLCYIETVDWAKITTGVTMSENYFKGNKDVQECVNSCPNTCDMTIEFDKEVHRCWTMNDCQKMLSPPANCETGFYNGKTCCDANCIGGCTGPSPQQCTACKQVMQYTGNGFPTCTKRCTAGTYMYKNRRCLLDWECLNFTDYPTGMGYGQFLKLIMSTDKRKPGLCAADCPPGYNTDSNDHQKCVLCKGKCPKKCSGKVIDSVNSVQELKDCNIVEGPLHIKLMQGGQIAQELEANLAQIEEVTEYIMISHSEALISLHCFKNLKRIGGSVLHQNKYVFYAYDNLNLQELFMEHVTSNLTIGNGTVLFQYNRKLCYNKIKTFVTSVGLDINKISAEEVSADNNGDQMPCDIQKLMMRSLKVSPHIAFVSWTKMNITGDARHLIGYTISWKVAPEKNVSIYKGRDACSDDLWLSKDVCTNKPCDRYINYIAGLEPWTQYAAYIRALTVSKALKGASSDVIYFRTAAEVPTSPINLQVKEKHPGELEVSWDPPNKPNGNVTHYHVYWQLRKFNQKEYELRNYCTNPLSVSLIKREIEEKQAEEKRNVTRNGTCCECPKTEKQLQVEERERYLEIQFQDYLQNQVYVKRLEPAETTIAARRRPKRSVASGTSHEVKKYTYQSSVEGTVTVNLTTMTPTVDTVTSPPPEDKVPKGEVSTENPYMMADVVDQRKFIITNLGHFEDYNIKVIACHTREADKDMLCSNQALGFGRTLPDSKADTINSSLVDVKYMVNKTGAVHIKWQDPPNPNGLILTYDIEYMNQNIKNVKPILICITYEIYRDVGKGGHLLDKLDPGNYTFRLRATSLAGNGSWTDYLYFTINNVATKEWPQNQMVAVVSSVVVVIFLCTVVAVWFITKRRFAKQVPDGMLVSTNPDYMADYAVYEPDDWEVDRDNVQLIKELGQGSFGMVYEGLVILTPGGEKTPVAVKTTNKNSNDHDRYQFLQEASIMKQFQCEHVVRLMGVVSQGQPAYVLMELMQQGDLKNFLRLHRPDEEDNNGRQPPSLKQILQMAGEIADGMAYLADKKFVHRDLAARNCMVGEDMIVKIGDFGMTRDIYETDYYRKGSRGLLPVRWMAPESLKDGVFTSMTDVWSYGVVLWEMATLAAQPYQGLSNEEVLRYVASAKIMDTPERCPTKLYDLMVKCWRYRPKQRPTFKEIIELLLPDLDQSFRDCSYFFSEENAKYEEAKHHGGASNNRDDYLETLDDEEDNDPHCPVNDYVDEAHLPMLGVGASNGHSVELQDIFSDTGSYPHYSSSHNKQHDGSAEVCDCSVIREQAGAAAQSNIDFTRQGVCSSPNSAIGGSSDGSKESSKSSSSSYAHMNGLSVANGHVPLHLQRTTPC
ncbi:insulin-like peptide receptor [Ruditapes philippinarum]|uniref:insulin-like peptide receptor n=1 Tax=Ruditapes philippinarum TaxID=129788 RepID=UPI00295B0281|nr:insulin-like peptide receptor [Ruditapes philippinarum]